jgi:hypothetical protein
MQHSNVRKLPFIAQPVHGRGASSGSRKAGARFGTLRGFVSVSLARESLIAWERLDPTMLSQESGVRAPKAEGDLPHIAAGWKELFPFYGQKTEPDPAANRVTNGLETCASFSRSIASRRNAGTT